MGAGENCVELGDIRCDEATGIKYRLGPVHQGGHAIVRDWGAPDVVSELRWSGLKHDAKRIEIGAENIRKNAERALREKGIDELTIKDADTVFLIGSGATLDFHIDWLPEIARRGVTIATNRAMYAFNGREELLDYGWVGDPEASKVTGDFWSISGHKIERMIASFDADFEPLRTPKEIYWYGACVGAVPEWEDRQRFFKIEKYRYGVLDSGFCSLFSQLHLIYKLSKRSKINQVVLLGHDFSLVNNRRYFDTPVKVDMDFQKLTMSPEHALVFTIDINGNLVTTQEYLLRQAKLIMVACQQLSESGIRVVNATEGGILYGKGIEKADLDDLL